MITGYLMLVAASFGIYFVLSGWEIGMSLLYLWRTNYADSKTGNGQSELNLFTPLWGVTYVFLILGLTIFAVMFNKVLDRVSHAVLSTLIAGLIALFIRSILLIYLFYNRGSHKLRPFLGKLLFLASLTIPLSFGLTGVYFMSGQPFWRTSLGWSLAGILLLSILSLALSFAYYFLSSSSDFFGQAKYKTYFISIVYCLSTAIGLQLVLNRTDQTRSLGLPYNIFILLAAAIPLVEIGLYLVYSGRLLWLYFSFLAATSPGLLVLSNRPYLIYGRQTISSAYRAISYGSTILIGIAIASPVILLGLGLLFWLLVKSIPGNNKEVNN